jgi:hypothetical protein
MPPSPLDQSYMDFYIRKPPGPSLYHTTPEEEAHEKALRRIREAEETGALELDLSGWNETAYAFIGFKTLRRLPPELERLTSLQSLELRPLDASGR